MIFYTNNGKNNFARLKKKKNPRTSVAVVKNIDEDNAGSKCNLCNSNGINKPATPAIIKFPIIAKKMINPR